MIIRVAEPSDSEAIGRLAAELDASAEGKAASGCLAKVLGRPDYLVLVAIREGEVVGWLQAHAFDVLVSGFRVDIIGLVVSGGSRRSGIGRALVGRAERWAAGLGAESVVVRSNTKRVESHRFYPALGYSLAKTQAVYRKQLRKRDPIGAIANP
jgi:predicted N-acetyltransferase YhbS